MLIVKDVYIVYPCGASRARAWRVIGAFEGSNRGCPWVRSAASEDNPVSHCWFTWAHQRLPIPRNKSIFSLLVSSREFFLLGMHCDTLWLSADIQMLAQCLINAGPLPATSIKLDRMAFISVLARL